ncbi:hypothetical protein [Fulvimarina endophytica]|uniref:hypothetical protein n=1 Tax=Fulvimarina endophytica TaxID=2293836 RepID=UPI0018F6446D|nr:hypothetical protein [Fulvimarina endophytica]
MVTRATTQSRSGRRGRTVKFGDVTVTAPAPSATAVKHNVERSTEALERLARRFARPGVSIRARKDVPLFSLDSEDPDVMVRTMNGRTERGHMVDGSFHAID